MNEPADITDLVQTAEELTEPVTIGVEAYISEEYARAERDKLWRKVWQQAGRVEEIPEVGNYLTYDILDDSILIVRTAPDKISRLLQCVPASRPPAGGYARKAPRTPAARRSSSSAASTGGATTWRASASMCSRRRTGRAR